MENTVEKDNELLNFMAINLHARAGVRNILQNLKIREVLRSQKYWEKHKPGFLFYLGNIVLLLIWCEIFLSSIYVTGCLVAVSKHGIFLIVLLLWILIAD